MNIRPLTEEEQKYTFDQSKQISAQCGYYGRMILDIPSYSKSYDRSFENARKKDVPEKLSTELDMLVTAFRYDDRFPMLFKDTATLRSICENTPGASFGKNTNCYGFRVDSGEYSYLLRLHPDENDKNVYCYCYKKDYLNEHITRAQNGIRFVTPRYKEKFRIKDGDSIRVTFPDKSSIDLECRFIDNYHLEIQDNVFHICEFAEKMEAAHNQVIPMRKSLPDFALVYISTEKAIGLVAKGTNGYFPVKPHVNLPTTEAKLKYIFEENKKEGVSDIQAQAMKAGSMFGWDKPAANPDNYTIDGKTIPSMARKEVIR